MSRNRKNLLQAVLDGSFLIGGVCTGVFYAIMLSPAMAGSALHRYTTEHIVEYVVVALSFWGIVDIVRKFGAFPREMLALRSAWLPERKQREPAGNAGVLLNEINERPTWLRDSRIGRRLRKALEFVVENGCTADYREQLHAMANEDADRVSNSYTLLRFLVRITPVLGFLGTVVHFGTALNGITFDDMTDRLPMVVSQMGQAFNTTTVALGAAMTIMFAQFGCEWFDRGILTSINRLVERELSTRFEQKDASISPFLSVVKSANDEALGMIAENLDRQTVVWTHAVDAILERFDSRQQLESHAWTQALDTLNARHEGYDAVREERLRHMLTAIEERQDKFMAHMQATLERVAAIRGDLGGLAATLNSVAQGEGRLVELQSVLADNLRVIQETQQIDDALHGLTAAIHLLTARHLPGMGPHAAAA